MSDLHEVLAVELEDVENVLNHDLLALLKEFNPNGNLAIQRQLTLTFYGQIWNAPELLIFFNDFALVSADINLIKVQMHPCKLNKATYSVLIQIECNQSCPY